MVTVPESAEKSGLCVIMTGHGDIPMTVRTMKAGAVDFLSKPFRDTISHAPAPSTFSLNDLLPSYEGKSYETRY